MKWQDVKKLLIGSVGVVTLFTALFLLTGFSYTTSGDMVCGETCESYINITTTYWRVCFDSYNGTKYEDETLFKKQTRSRTLHVNLDKVDNIISTEPKVDVDWLVPTYGKKWRPIKNGDCWERGKINKIKLVGHKEKYQTVKWSFDLGDKVNIDPIWEGDKPKGFIGYGGGFKWNFETEREDNDIYTEIEVINETVLEITIDKKHELPGGYKWDMAICNIKGIDTLKYMEEDAQGGFNNSFPINLNYGKLTNYGMNSSWCGGTNGYGFILFSGGSKNQLPKHFRIIFPEGEKEFKLFTGKETEVLIGVGSSTPIKYGMYQKIVKDSTGELHLVWMDGGRDVQHSNSTDGGITWSTEEIALGTSINSLNLLINSTDGMFIFYVQPNNYNVTYIESADAGVTWSSPAFIPSFHGNSTDKFSETSVIMDDNDNIHVCSAVEEWNDVTTNDWLAYTNRTSSGWSSMEWVNQNSADDTDSCDIETDSNGVVYIVAYGTDGSDIDIWTSANGWGSANRIQIHSGTGDTFPSIFIDKNDKIIVSWEQDSNDLGFANSTSALATTTWTTTTIDLESSLEGDIKITDRGDIYIIYYAGFNPERFNIYRAFWNSTTNIWTNRTLLHNSSFLWNSNPFPSMRGSRIGSDTITDTIDYMYWNDTDNGFYFDSFSVTAPPIIDTCTYSSGNWDVTCSDNCSITENVNLGGNNLILSNDFGHFNVLSNISNFDKIFKYDLCQIRIYSSGGFNTQ